MYYSQSQVSIVSKGTNDNVLFTTPSRHSVQKAPATMYYSQRMTGMLHLLKQFIDVFLLFCFIAPRQAYIKLCIHNLKSRRKDTSNQISFISPFVIELSVCSFKKVLQLTICICSVLSGSYTVFLKCLVF